MTILTGRDVARRGIEASVAEVLAAVGTAATAEDLGAWTLLEGVFACGQDQKVAALRGRDRPEPRCHGSHDAHRLLHNSDVPGRSVSPPLQGPRLRGRVGRPARRRKRR